MALLADNVVVELLRSGTCSPRRRRNFSNWIPIAGGTALHAEADYVEYNYDDDDDYYMSKSAGTTPILAFECIRLLRLRMLAMERPIGTTRKDENYQHAVASPDDWRGECVDCVGILPLEGSLWSSGAS